MATYTSMRSASTLLMRQREQRESGFQSYLDERRDRTQAYPVRSHLTKNHIHTQRKMDDILIGLKGEIIEPYGSYKSALSQKSDKIDFLMNQVVDFVVTKERRKQQMPIKQLPPSKKQELVKALCQENYFFKELCNKLTSLKKLTDLQLLANIQDVPTKNLDAWISDWTTFGRKINRLVAIQLISNLPVAIQLTSNPPISLRMIDQAIPSDLDEQDLERLKFKILSYKKVGAWLWSWERELDIPSETKDFYQPFHALALLAEARYKLIRGLFDTGNVNRNFFPRPSFVWILSEAAFCRRLFENKFPRHNLYKAYKSYINLLWDFEPPLMWRQIKELPDLIYNTDLIFAEFGREEAKRNEIFRKSYFKPYTEALKIWNARTRNGNAAKVPQF